MRKQNISLIVLSYSLEPIVVTNMIQIHFMEKHDVYEN